MVFIGRKGAMTWKLPHRNGPPWLVGFASDKQYEAYAEQQERQKRRREELQKWAFEGLPTKEELAAAQVRVERRWICVVEGHDWQTVETAADGYEVQQCYRCDNVRFLRQKGGGSRIGNERRCQEVRQMMEGAQ